MLTSFCPAIREQWQAGPEFFREPECAAAGEQPRDAEVPKRSHFIPSCAPRCTVMQQHPLWNPLFCPADLTPHLPTHTRLGVYPRGRGLQPWQSRLEGVTVSEGALSNGGRETVA